MCDNKGNDGKRNPNDAYGGVSPLPGRLALPHGQLYNHDDPAAAAPQLQWFESLLTIAANWMHKTR